MLADIWLLSESDLFHSRLPINDIFCFLHHCNSDVINNDFWYAFEKERFCFHHCDAISTPSHDLKQKIIELYQVTVEVFIYMWGEETHLRM